MGSRAHAPVPGCSKRKALTFSLLESGYLKSGSGLGTEACPHACLISESGIALFFQRIGLWPFNLLTRERAKPAFEPLIDRGISGRGRREDISGYMVAVVAAGGGDFLLPRLAGGEPSCDFAPLVHRKSSSAPLQGEGF